MFSSTVCTFTIAALALLSSPGHVLATSCPAGSTNHLCCESFGHFSDNYGVWHNLCGLNFPNSTTVGGSCEALSTCPEGIIALCCESEASLAQCGGSVDGSLGINCVQVEN